MGDWGGASVPGAPLGFYVHVPFCAVRCGYCDFNTYTATELGGGGSQAAYAGHAVAEVELAARTLGPDRRVETVFFGGGTPTLLPAEDLARLLGAIDEHVGLAPDAEVTTEANPDSVTPEGLARLREAGFTRVSFGMQSAVTHVLAVLERTHDPAGVARAVRWAREAGFEQVSLDLIYGTPGETAADWFALPGRRAGPGARPRLGLQPDRRGRHPPGPSGPHRRGADARRGRPRREVRTGRRRPHRRRAGVVRGLELGPRRPLPLPPQTSSTGPAPDWWGVGPGPTPTSPGERWWNLKHPSAYAARLTAGESPRQDGESSTTPPGPWSGSCSRCACATGCRWRPWTTSTPSRPPTTPAPAATGSPGRDRRSGHPRADDRLVLTRPGRLLADGVVRTLVGD